MLPPGRRRYRGLMDKASILRNARKSLTPLTSKQFVAQRKEEAEGGCGVVGLMSSVPIAGKHLFVPSLQMQNRGNGKGGGIAAVGLVSEEMKVPQRVLNEDYILQLAYMDPSSRPEIEKDWIFNHYEIDDVREIPTLDDYREAGLEVKPPDVVRYFARARSGALQQFAEQKELRELKDPELEDEFVFQQTCRINKTYYASLGEKRAFVMSHAKNLLVFKLVGYAERVIDYYRLHDFRAHGWIAHQRYPTKGRVWHPGGAHPFIGMHEALVHNGDFANYYGVCEYLKQHGLFPLFLTDTEVSVLLFDLLSRSFDYPLEWVIESMAPTTERDFQQLPPERRDIYKVLQLAHMNGSPDGPWFFIIARNDTEKQQYQLLGITDTSMLRPQVFAIHEGEVQIGLIASEKQAIDATLQSIAAEDPRVCPVADQYWNARGGSHTDGGAFLFSVDYSNGVPPASPRHAAGTAALLRSTNKFGEEIAVRQDAKAKRPTGQASLPYTLEALTSVQDHACETPALQQEIPHKWFLAQVNAEIDHFLDRAPWTRITCESRNSLQPPPHRSERLVIDARGFSPEGPQSLSLLIVRAYSLGWREIIVYRCSGHRFIGCGLQENSKGLRIHVYGSSGDYLASGLDGAEIYVHGNAQDQIGQIFHNGKLVIYGDVGQTFFYGAKGGNAYIMGNAAGRPLINAVGCPRVVINGTCLDYLAESFMAGDPLKGGGFVILNGIRWNDHGQIEDLPTPYPGSNLFSLASGGAIYVRDPHKRLEPDQLNGGEFVEPTDDDWNLIVPYLQHNEALFHVRIDRDLLRGLPPSEVYRKIRPLKTEALK
jgi:glutamate synthase domain-containing protein 1/glutamate synthase domain-containing protein 3